MRAGGAAVPGYFAFRAAQAASPLPSSSAALASQVSTAQVGTAAGGSRLRQLQRITWLRLAALLLVMLRVGQQGRREASTVGCLRLARAWWHNLLELGHIDCGQSIASNPLVQMLLLRAHLASLISVQQSVQRLLH
jgi:hypothetical protein